MEGRDEGEEEGEDGWEDMRMPRTSSCEQGNKKVQEEDERIYVGTRLSLSIHSNRDTQEGESNVSHCTFKAP